MDEYVLDLTSIYSNIDEKVEINQDILFDSEYLINSDIIELKKVHVIGNVEKNLNDELSIYAKVEGVMVLEDAISLDLIDYPFSCEIDENIDEKVKKGENTLDLKEILWENIVLEVPLKFTEVKDFSKFHGDGWKLIDENEIQKNHNPFGELLEEFGEE